MMVERFLLFLVLLSLFYFSPAQNDAADNPEEEAPSEKSHTVKIVDPLMKGFPYEIDKGVAVIEPCSFRFSFTPRICEVFREQFTVGKI